MRSHQFPKVVAPKRWGLDKHTKGAAANRSILGTQATVCCSPSASHSQPPATAAPSSSEAAADQVSTSDLQPCNITLQKISNAQLDNLLYDVARCDKLL